ncbi:MAG: hypothetical protein A2Z16_08265 [Chloroflexi bacterium RBG_16_54_18]|nr:MAG: hypothetical protein A2Z16_08265 [Chloroflexi bacterium RBG_16_54_18]
MKILFLSLWFPFPQDNGSRIRVNYLLLALHGKHQVHLISYLPSNAERNYLPEMERLCDHFDFVECDPFWRDPRQRLTGHLSLRPRDIIRGYNQEMEALVREVSYREHFDILIASCLEVAPYLLQIEHARRILEEHNFTTSWMHERFEDQEGVLRRAAGWVTWQKCRRYERWLYPQFQAVTMVSGRDLRAVKETIPGYQGRLEVVPNGVDLSSHHLGIAAPVNNTLVFNGALTYAANLEAMRFFTGSVLPLIRERCPEIKLTITGSTQGVDLGWLPQGANITLTGRLDDVRPTVAGAWLAVAPILSGGGTRLKILEGMALGTPVVASSKGAEGLAVTHGENIMIADEPRDFADACLKLLSSEDLRQRLAASARRFVEEQHDWQAIGRRFCELVESVFENQAASKSI